MPPPGLLAEVAALVRAQEPPPPEPVVSEERRGLFGRRAAEPPQQVEPEGPLLDVLDPSDMRLPITDFGFVQPATAQLVWEAATRVAERYSPPRVVLSGGAALIDEDDRHVWVDLAADDDGVEVLRGIARDVVAAVEPLGFYRDRRQYRSRIALATVNDRSSVEHLEAVLAALDAYTSEPWTVDAFVIIRRGSGIWQTVPIGA
jgi:hypothetical protein